MNNEFDKHRQMPEPDSLPAPTSCAVRITNDPSFDCTAFLTRQYYPEQDSDHYALGYAIYIDGVLAQARESREEFGWFNTDTEALLWLIAQLANVAPEAVKPQLRRKEMQLRSRSLF